MKLSHMRQVRRPALVPTATAGSAGPPQELPGQLVNAADSEEGHGPFHVEPEPLQDPVDAALTGRAQRIQIGAAGHDRRGARGDGLDDVTAPADATVTDDLRTTADRIGDRRDQLERRGRTIELPS